MSAPGFYEETLPCGGKLKVGSGNWRIQYYFSGPDLRYNGTIVEVSGQDVDQYIEAFCENFEEFEKLKSTIPPGGEFTKAGKKGMTIKINGFGHGVCLKSYHLPIENRVKLEKVVNGYKYAKERATNLMQILSTI